MGEGLIVDVSKIIAFIDVACLSLGFTAVPDSDSREKMGTNILPLRSTAEVQQWTLRGILIVKYITEAAKRLKIIRSHANFFSQIHHSLASLSSDATTRRSALLYNGF